jgi:hypothetical protein
VISEWNLGAVLNVAEYESVELVKRFGDMVYRELSAAKLPSSQVNRLTRGPKFASHPHQVGERIRFHFLHDLPTMCLYRDLADTELAANLFIQQPRDD